MATVRFACERGLPVAIRCGGHNVAGKRGGRWRHRHRPWGLKSVRVDPAERRARAGGGLLWCEYDHETPGLWVASPGGAISTTGIAGLTLGGGTATCRGVTEWLATTCSRPTWSGVRRAGDGECRHPSRSFLGAARRRREFWGGDGVRISTFIRVREALSGLIAFPFEMSKTVLQQYRDLCMEASDDLTLMAESCRLRLREDGRRGDEPFRDGRGGRTRHSADSRAGIRF